jgi:DNA-binding response OmpR family regulator
MSTAAFLGMHYEVMTASDGEEGLDIATRHKPDLVVLDITLPGIDGLEVCKRLRAVGYRAPVLFLTARDQEVDKLTGFGVGGDDYIVKPVSLAELQARVHAALRRAQGQLSEYTDVHRWGSVEVNLSTLEVKVGGDRVTLSAKEMELLRYFLEHRGAVVTREQLLTDVWHYDEGVSSRTIDTHVLNLRKKLRDGEDGTRYLHTVRGIGYRFDG